MPETQKIAIGSQVPDFDLESFSQEGGARRISSNELKGKPYILAFYPKDDTPGCTKEMCAFRDDFASFKASGILVYGVSKDSIKSHEKFSNKYEFGSLTLLSDSLGALSESLGIGEEFPKRTLFAIGKDGKIKYIHEGMPKNAELIELLEKLL
ncbi:MAG: peroxiredoxin [Candidatus Caenarcaniphilales bacterium]|nr:peroxiredoxin [Candidatus Caenarcaniphilales bacterium]